MKGSFGAIDAGICFEKGGRDDERRENLQNYEVCRRVEPGTWDYHDRNRRIYRRNSDHERRKAAEEKVGNYVLADRFWMGAGKQGISALF